MPRSGERACAGGILPLEIANSPARLCEFCHRLRVANVAVAQFSIRALFPVSMRVRAFSILAFRLHAPLPGSSNVLHFILFFPDSLPQFIGTRVDSQVSHLIFKVQGDRAGRALQESAADPYYEIGSDRIQRLQHAMSRPQTVWSRAPPTSGFECHPNSGRVGCRQQLRYYCCGNHITSSVRLPPSAH